MNPVIQETTEKYRVLFIGGEGSARLVLSHLQKVGLGCRYAPDAPTGLVAFRENNIHLILLDLGPREGAATLCARIRESSTKPLLMMAEEDEHEFRVRSLKMGADDCISKPIDPHLLVARVCALLRRSYIYERDNHDEAAPPLPHPSLRSGMPADWASCEACNYLGPEARFWSQDSQGQAAMICPYCRVPAGLTYALV